MEDEWGSSLTFGRGILSNAGRQYTIFVHPCFRTLEIRNISRCDFGPVFIGGDVTEDDSASVSIDIRAIAT
jgi:hypothetical protein